MTAITPSPITNWSHACLACWESTGSEGRHLVQFSSKWYRRARKNPYALVLTLGNVLSVAFETMNNVNVRLTDDGPFSSVQEKSSRTPLSSPLSSPLSVSQAALYYRVGAWYLEQMSGGLAATDTRSGDVLHSKFEVVWAVNTKPVHSLLVVRSLSLKSGLRLTRYAIVFAIRCYLSCENSACLIPVRHQVLSDGDVMQSLSVPAAADRIRHGLNDNA